MRVKQEMTTVCDFCGQRRSLNTACTGCGKDICYDCRNTVATEYPHSAYVSGSGDGLYCHACDEKCVNDPLHRAYKKIQALIRESIEFREDFQERAKMAEEELKRILGERGIT